MAIAGSSGESICQQWATYNLSYRSSTHEYRVRNLVSTSRFDHVSRDTEFIEIWLPAILLERVTSSKCYEENFTISFAASTLLLKSKVFHTNLARHWTWLGTVEEVKLFIIRRSCIRCMRVVSVPPLEGNYHLMAKAQYEKIIHLVYM